LGVVEILGGLPVESPSGGRSDCRSSAAWRNETPSVRITQSITEPPASQAPRQCQRFLAGVITRLGSWSPCARVVVETVSALVAQYKRGA
jgi:hypothetical protein